MENMNTTTATTTPATIAEPTAAPTTATGDQQNRDAAAPTFQRTTRHFDIGDGLHILDTRKSGGSLELVEAEPTMHFENVPTMTGREAIEAVLNWPEVSSDWRRSMLESVNRAEAIRIRAATR